jgi:hypothetical protein
MSPTFISRQQVGGRRLDLLDAKPRELQNSLNVAVKLRVWASSGSI